MDENERDFREGKLPLPVGKSDWEYVAAHNYCVDKTLLIRDLLATDAGVALFTRPRRFGKTTAMQMLKCFFEKRGEGEPSVRHLFESRAISKCKRADEWMSHLGKYPVIYLTFKDHKALTWEEAFERLAIDVGNEFKRHLDCVESLSPGQEREDFIDICERRASPARLGESLGFLARALHVHSRVQPIVLIDEYDMPVTTASTNGYYTEMVAFMRAFLPNALKDNNHVKMGVMTGVLRVAKEGMLSGLNNLKVYTVFDEPFSEYFGVTPDITATEEIRRRQLQQRLKKQAEKALKERQNHKTEQELYGGSGGGVDPDAAEDPRKRVSKDIALLRRHLKWEQIIVNGCPQVIVYLNRHSQAAAQQVTFLNGVLREALQAQEYMRYLPDADLEMLSKPGSWKGVPWLAYAEKMREMFDYKPLHIFRNDLQKELRRVDLATISRNNRRWRNCPAGNEILAAVA